MAETLKETIKEAVKEVAEAGEAKITAGEAKVSGVVKEVEAKVEKAEQAVRLEISDAEKLAVRNLENEFLKAQMEIQRLTTMLKNTQESFPKLVESLVTKYGIDKAIYVFDAVELVFKKR